MDRDFGPFFLKVCTYFPYTVKVCLNGREYVKRQLTKAGIAYEALDNGLLSCADPKRAQTLCNRLSAEKIEGLVRKWLRVLPSPFTPADTREGYRYVVSVLQAEFSLTQVFDRPATGRLFFEEVIRENLDLGRPSHVSLIFHRRITRQTPGRFRTRVITEGVTPTPPSVVSGARARHGHLVRRRQTRRLTNLTHLHQRSVFKCLDRSLR